MPQTPIGLRLDDGLLRRVDAARGDVPRARWIAAALERALSPEAERARSAGSPGRSPSPEATPTRTPSKAKRVAVFASLEDEYADIRRRPGLSLSERIQLEGEARRRWGNQ